MADVFTSYFLPSFRISSQQMHMATMRDVSTFGATVKWYVCCLKMSSLTLNLLRSMRATTALVASSNILAFVFRQLPFMRSVTDLP